MLKYHESSANFETVLQKCFLNVFFYKLKNEYTESKEIYTENQIVTRISIFESGSTSKCFYFNF